MPLASSLLGDLCAVCPSATSISPLSPLRQLCLSVPHIHLPCPHCVNCVCPSTTSVSPVPTSSAVSVRPPHGSPLSPLRQLCLSVCYIRLSPVPTASAVLLCRRSSLALARPFFAGRHSNVSPISAYCLVADGMRFPDGDVDVLRGQFCGRRGRRDLCHDAAGAPRERDVPSHRQTWPLDLGTPLHRPQP
jgi:hypothetical protein